MEDLLNTRGIGFDYKRPTLVKHKSQSQIIHPDYTLHISSLIIDYFPHPEKEGRMSASNSGFVNKKCKSMREGILIVATHKPNDSIRGGKTQMNPPAMARIMISIQRFRAKDAGGRVGGVGVLPFCPGLLPAKIEGSTIITH
jgi:hypothetical protein